MFVVEDYEQKQWAHSAGTIFSCLFSGSSAGRRSADRWGLSFVLIWDLLESCFRFRCSALRFSVCLTKTKPSAAVSWSPLDREVGWFRLSLVDFGCLGSSAGCLVSSERPHSDRGAHLSVWMVSFSSNWGPAGGATSTAVHLTVQVRYRQQFVLTGTDKKFNLQIFFSCGMINYVCLM